MKRLQADEESLPEAAARRAGKHDNQQIALQGFAPRAYVIEHKSEKEKDDHGKVFEYWFDAERRLLQQF